MKLLSQERNKNKAETLKNTINRKQDKVVVVWCFFFFFEGGHKEENSVTESSNKEKVLNIQYVNATKKPKGLRVEKKMSPSVTRKQF